MVFANPNYLYLLLLLIPMIGWYVYKLSKSQASLQVSSSEAFEAPAQTRAEDAHYACSNNMSPPDQQGDGRKQVKQR